VLVTDDLLLFAQVAMGIGYALFLVDPDHAKVKELEVFEPAEAVSEPVNPEADAGGKGELLLSTLAALIGCGIAFVSFSVWRCPSISLMSWSQSR
jgi:hypothetical protein